VIYNLHILTAIPAFFLLFSINLLPSNIQNDSTIKTIDVPVERVESDFRINLYDLFYPNNNGYNYYKLSDSSAFMLNIELLNQRLNSDYIFQSPLSEQWRINSDLTNYIQFNRDLALRSELGVFGEVLGNAKTFTAIILAILHVIKYRKVMY
jgi:hypothetical protein